MRPSVLIAATLLALGPLAAPAPAAAQGARDGAIDCGNAPNPTVAVICASPRLVELQNIAAGEYRAMANRIGEAAASLVAREQLSLRDACGPDSECIEQRLVAAMGLFMATNAPPSTVIEPLPPAISLDPALPPIQVGPPGAAPDYPVGPDGVLVLPVVTEVPSGFIGDLSPEDRLLYGPPVEVPGTAERLRPPPPLEGVFKDQPESRRMAIQVRLALAGLGGAPDGVWGPQTEGALRDAADEARAAGRTVDLTTPQGVSAYLDYIESRDFETDLLGG